MRSKLIFGRTPVIYQCSTRNRQCGQALVEGVVSIAMIIGCAVGVILLVVNCGISVYYKEKMAFAVNQAAEFAYTVPKGVDIQAATRDYVMASLPRIGVQPRNLDVKVNVATKIAGQPSALVTVSNDFSLFGKGSILPLFVRMSETGLATVPSNVVAFAGPPGPRGPAGPMGPQGPPAAANKFDAQEIQRVAGFAAYGTMGAAGSGQTVTFPIYNWSPLLQQFPSRNFFIYGPWSAVGYRF